MIDFSNNVNFIGPPNGFNELLLNNSNSYFEYPDYQHKAARNAISEFFNISDKSVVISVGATELLSIMPSFSKKTALGISPSFWEYQHFYIKAHAENKYQKFVLDQNQDFKFNHIEFEARLSKHEIDICYLANPNNPTTTRLDKASILDIAKKNPDVLFVIDETYLPFSASYQTDSFISEASVSENIIVITSMSKIYSLPGLRVGFGVSHPKNIERLYGHLIPYGVAPFPLVVIPWLLDQKEYISNTNLAYNERRRYLNAALSREFGDKVKVVDSGTAFVLIEIKIPLESDFVSRLLSLNIRVRGGAEFVELGNQWIRISIRDYCDIDVLIEGLKLILN